jgi:hypothetical protein
MRVSLAPFVFPGERQAAVVVTLGARRPASGERCYVRHAVGLGDVRFEVQ